MRVRRFDPPGLLFRALAGTGLLGLELIKPVQEFFFARGELRLGNLAGLQPHIEFAQFGQEKRRLGLTLDQSERSGGSAKGFAYAVLATEEKALEAGFF
jgi:hypothetical protein